MVTTNMNPGGSSKWMSSAVQRPGALHRALNVPMGETIPKAKIAAAKNRGGRVAKEANLASVFDKFRP